MVILTKLKRIMFLITNRLNFLTCFELFENHFVKIQQNSLSNLMKFENEGDLYCFREICRKIISETFHQILN